jgi:hypothetical protein
MIEIEIEIEIYPLQKGGLRTSFPRWGVTVLCFNDKTRGKGFALFSFATTKAKEHIVVYCPGINTKENSFDANLRHTLLVNLPKGVLSTINKAGLALRKFHCVCMLVSSTVLT